MTMLWWQWNKLQICSMFISHLKWFTARCLCCCWTFRHLKIIAFFVLFFWADLKSIHQVKHHSNLLFASKIIKYTLLPLKYLFHHFQFCHHLKHKICIATKSTSFMPLTPTWVNIVTISHICTRAHICLRRRFIYLTTSPNMSHVPLKIVTHAMGFSKIPK